MSIIGHLIALLGLYVLYIGAIIWGSILFSLGGIVAHKLYVSLRSSGFVNMVISIAYGYHNEFTPLVLFLIFVGFVLACFTTKRASRDSGDGWGINLDLSSGSSSDGGGGDCGGGGD